MVLIHLYSKKYNLSKVINLNNATELGYDELLNSIIIKYISGETCILMNEIMLEDIAPNIFIEKLVDKIYSGSDNQILIDVDKILNTIHEEENITNSIK